MKDVVLHEKEIEVYCIEDAEDDPSNATCKRAKIDTCAFSKKSEKGGEDEVIFGGTEWLF